MNRSVVVVGAGVGGLSAAIHARLRGFDVLLVEQGDRLGGKAAAYELDGFRVDPGPSIVILPRIFQRVFVDAGRRPDDYLRFRRLDPVSHVFMEGEREWRIPARRDACLEHVAERHPEDARALGRLFNRLDQVSPHIDRSVFARPYERGWQLADPHLIAFAARFDLRATYKELIDRWFQSPLLRAFFYGFPSYGGQSYDRKAPGALIIPYLMLTEGVFFPDGGVGAIPAALGRLAAELGVEIRTGARVMEMRSARRRVVSAALAGGDELSAEAFICNVDRSTCRQWLGHPETARPSLSYFTVHLGVRRKITGLGHHNLFIPQGFERGFEALYRRREFPNPPIVYVNATSVVDPTAAPEGCENVFAVVSTPAESPKIDWARETSQFRNRLVRQIERAGFEISDREIQFERIQTPSFFAHEHGNYRGSLYGVDEASRPFGGTFPHASRDPDFSNLFYCGGSVQPGAGLPMVTLSGKFAARML